MKTLALVMATLAAAASAGLATAQPYGAASRGGDRATLYELPNFQGRQMAVYGHQENLPRAFNDIARSARFEGRWRICEDSDYRGRCVDVQGDVADLNSVGFAERISSLQSYDDRADEDDRYDGDDRVDRGYGGGRPGYDDDRDRVQDRRGVDGARNTFFAYPNSRGADIPATAGAADRFCRAQGLGAASYFDAEQRSSRPYDDRSRYGASGPVLRDVLCRR